MIPELAIAMLACARIGAPHSIVFGGCSPDSLRDRIRDCKAKVLITPDDGYRRGKVHSWIILLLQNLRLSARAMI